MEYFDLNENEHYKIIQPLVKAEGLELVEIISAMMHDGLHLHIVIYSQEGVSISNCSKIHKTAQRRIEALTGSRDMFLEVSSPGITRNFKSANEFIIFIGKSIRILFDKNSEWIKAVIKDADESGVILNISGTEEKIPYSGIRKAKLDF